MEAMLGKVIMFGIVLGIGMLAIATKRVGENVRDALPTLILQITAPLMIYSNIAKLSPSPELWGEALTVTAVGFVIIISQLLIANLYVKLRKLGPEIKGLQIALMSFGNVIFLAYPLIKSLYGEKGVLFSMFFYLASDALFWTIGSIEITNKRGAFKDMIKHISTNPVFIAFVLGLISMATNIKPNDFIMAPLSGLGDTTTYTSLLFIGMTLPLVDFKSIFKRFEIYIVLFLKLLIYPIIVALILFKLPNFGLSEIAIGSIILQVAMPCMTTITVLAKEYDQDFKYSVGVVFISTAASLLTLLINFKIIELLK